MANNKPTIDTSTIESTDKPTERESTQGADQQTATPSPTDSQAPENVLITPFLADGATLNPLFILHVDAFHSKAYGEKGWKETQQAVTGHKGVLSESDKGLIDKVFTALKRWSKRESLGIVERSDTSVVRTDKRIYYQSGARRGEAERISDIRCTRAIEYID